MGRANQGSVVDILWDLCYNRYMSTSIFQPHFLEVEDWRDIQRNNRSVGAIPFSLITSETWLPLILSQAGFFKSNGEVKKNRPEFWRDVVDGETITIGKWARIKVTHAEALA